MAKRIASNEADRETFVANWNRELMETLSDVQRQRASLEQQTISATRRTSLSQLVAEQDAVVLEIADLSVGSVIKQGDSLMSLVPDKGPLEAEVEIETQDIGWVRTGAQARIKFETLPYQQHGTADGTVRVIARDAQTTELPGGGKRYTYRAKVSIDKMQLKRLPPNFALIPGMRVTAEINVGTRTVLSFLLNPFTKSLDSALREP